MQSGIYLAGSAYVNPDYVFERHFTGEIVKFAKNPGASEYAPMTLEEKVLDYINKHPLGVKISEMEEPLGETRMKLGFIAKALLEEGKVQKIENVYFPIK